MSHVSALKVNNPIDPNEISAYDYDETAYVTSTAFVPQVTNSMEYEARLLELKNERLKWIALTFVCITILCILFVITLIWYFTCGPSKRNQKAGFQPVQPNSSNV